MALEVLKAAIATRKPVRFQYNKQGKTPGHRVGNPHAVFILRRVNGTESTKVHIVQTGGVSDSGQEFPSFRMFDLSGLSDVEIESSARQFEVSNEYNPEWSGYEFVIAKV
jgi:hypothetical protein